MSRHKYFTQLPEPLNLPPEVSAYRQGDGGLRWTRRLEDKSSLDLQPRFALCSCAESFGVSLRVHKSEFCIFKIWISELARSGVELRHFSR